MKTIVDLTEELKEYSLEKDTAAKQAVEANIAPVEANTSSASRAYVVGEQLFLNDVLYDVTSQISVGDAIVVGTNITAANKLSADIKSKIDDLYSKNQTLETDLGNKVNTSDIANNLTTTTAGKVLDARQGKALNDSITNKHKITRKTVNTSSWTADTSSQSGSTLYKKSISLSHVYVNSPSVDISTSSGTGLPTTAQQEAYDLIQYVTVDGTTMYLYASAIPSETFYIGIEGVD